MRKTRLTLPFLIAFSMMTTVVLAQQPVPKFRACPAGYFSSGGFCVPTTNVPVAIEKVGPCPSGYYSSGSYCLATKGAKKVIVKTGACPSGWITSARYCLKVN